MKFHTAIVSVSLAASAPAQVENSASASIWWSPAVTITVIIAGVAIWAASKFEPQIRNRLENMTHWKSPWGEAKFASPTPQMVGRKMVEEIPEGTDLDKTQKEAEGGNANTQFMLGLMCHEGVGVPQDYAAAAKWFHRAAEQGLATAQNNLGVMHAKGEGVPQDYVEAVKWYRRAAKQGLAEAQHNCGQAHHDGQGVPQDDEEAIKWFRRAAEQGHVQSQHALAIEYFVRSGFRKNEMEAYIWMSIAADNGYEDAAAKRTDFAKRFRINSSEVQKEVDRRKDEIRRNREEAANRKD